MLVGHRTRLQLAWHARIDKDLHRMRWAVALVLVGCGDQGGDIVGPFTGDVHRYVIDRIAMPANTSDFADDLDGDGQVDNGLGGVMATLANTHDATTHGQDMIASGALSSVLKLQADSLDSDSAAGATWLGSDGDLETAMGGSIAARAFTSNRSRTTHVPGNSELHLPILADADPLVVMADGLELDLSPDGNGGFDALVRGAMRIELAQSAAYDGILQMLTNDPGSHLIFARLVDGNHDGVVTRDEIAATPLLAAIISADVHMFDGDVYAPTPSGVEDVISLGFSAHLVPCDSGNCAITTPADACHDRITDGAETDIDCGGGCAPCADYLSCAAPADCQSGACDMGRCRAATCSDGVRDGFESDVDCGGGCSSCQSGSTCAVNGDCTSNVCNGGTTTLGTCGA
jgi:hypothetical protein